jgi:hypothetical protein
VAKTRCYQVRLVATPCYQLLAQHATIGQSPRGYLLLLASRRYPQATVSSPVMTRREGLREKANFSSKFNKSARRANHPKVCPAPLRKIFLLAVDPNHRHIRRILSHSGALATSQARDGLRWTRRRARRAMPMRTAKSCGSDTPTLVSSWRNETSTTVSTSPVTEETTYKP